MTKEKKMTKICSFRLSEEDYRKIEELSKLKHCTKSEVITEALNNNAENLDSRSLYKEMMFIHDNLVTMEKKSHADTTEIRKGLMRICRILNTNEKV